MTTPSIDFVLGFSCLGIVVLLYLAYEFIGLFRELLMILRELLEELRNEKD